MAWWTRWIKGVTLGACVAVSSAGCGGDDDTAAGRSGAGSAGSAGSSGRICYLDCWGNKTWCDGDELHEVHAKGAQWDCVGPAPQCSTIPTPETVTVCEFGCARDHCVTPVETGGAGGSAGEASAGNGGAAAGEAGAVTTDGGQAGEGGHAG